jgi:hypothetical protein
MPKPRARDRDFEDGELGLVVGGKAHAEPMPMHEQQRWYQELWGFARDRGYHDGWAFYKCKEKGFTPPWAWRNLAPLDPSPATKSWAKSRIIAFAKRRRAA